MAISANASILAMLKVYYKKEGISNLLFRNSPLLKKINKERVEGKEQRFAAMYSRGGAASGSFLVAKGQAASVSGSAEFCVTPGQLFSVYTMNAKEVAASKSNAGAYMRIGGAKMFAASESFRKTLAAALYGSGYGEICAVPTGGWSFTADTAATITLPEDAIMKIDVGSKLVVKATKTTAETSATNTLVVKAINGTSVTVIPSANDDPSAGEIVCLAGSMNGSAPALPVGLDGWLPVYKKRTGESWAGFADDLFFGVDRSVSFDRLGGAFYDATSAASADTQKKTYAVTQLIKKLRRQGSLCDMIVMNDDDFLEFAREIETSNTYFTQTSTKAKKEATVGFSDISAAFSTNYVENIIDDPYAIKGRFYVLSSDAVEFWGYTNVDKALNDGVEGNNPGKQDPMAMDADGKENDPLQLLIDDLFTVSGGEDTIDGPATMVTLNLFGSFVVTNPSVCGVGEFYGSTDFAAA
jgi:hypothetical protein